jgi:hypothetical protein
LLLFPSLSDGGDRGKLARRFFASASASGFRSPPLPERSRRKLGSLDPPPDQVVEDVRRRISGGVLGSSSSTAVDADESELQERPDVPDPTESSEYRFSGFLWKGDVPAGVVGSFESDERSLTDGFRPIER